MTRKRGPSFWFSLTLLMIAIGTFAVFMMADDGPMFRHPVSRTPDMESEKAQLSMMQFYVPATSRNGELTTLEYFADRDGDNQPDELIETRDYAKPLVASYWDEIPLGAYQVPGGSLTKTKGVTIQSGIEIGPEVRRDAFGAISLDDGKTWKEQNLSESALATSFTLENGIEYPGDVPEVVHAIAGNKILVAWTSKYCAQGSPRYSVKDELDADQDGDVEEAIYEDLFDVAGNQGSIDYTEWMHHGDYPFAYVGEIPFSCVWTARGTVQQVTNPQTGALQWGVQWRKAERLTSGKRDAFYLAIDGVENAGFSLAWQEDPEGLRPGYGEGPGIGWSGATVNHKTDIWYSTIGWDDFDLVDISTQDPETNKPKVAERMSMPLRISDNYNCLSDRVDSDGLPHPGFCFEDFNLNGTADLCAETYAWTNSQGEVKNICVTEDGRLLNGQTGSSRTRMMLEGYTKADGTRSAWVILTYEETKGLGAGHAEEGEEEVEALDIGKDVIYHSFDMATPDIAAPGTMINLPETDITSDPENPTLLPLLVNDKGEYQYNTTIGRRPSLVVQPASRIAEAVSAGTTAGMTSAIVLYKDGSQRQGGPSDVFMRRLTIPYGFNPTVDNPYDIKNLVCTQFDTNIVTTSPSAYPISAYPNGVCLRGAINISGTTPLTFEPLDNTSEPVVQPPGHIETTAACSTCHEGQYDDDGLPSHGITERVLTFEQTEEDLGDEQWENKYEVAKGHRGFIDGDFVMLMYAYSPNWLATSHGHEPYNLFIRRSFDGGLTWTTTPSSLGGDGVSYDQVFGVGDRVWTLTRTLGAGEYEPARNVSQITTSKETVLDPRYSPTNIGTQSNVTRILQPDGTYQILPLGLYADDIRDPSKFFAVYETGDATTILLGGEADPLDLFGSRATNYGDDWESVDVFAQGRGEWEERWDWLENKKDVLSGEASMAASPGGSYAWVVWNEWMEDLEGHVYESDPMFRRLWWDEVSDIVADAGTYEASEGEIVTLSGSATYTSAITFKRLTLLSGFVYTWDLDMDGIFETEGQNVTLTATGAMQGAALRVCDGAGNCDIDQGWINPKIHAPRVWRVQASPEAAAVGTLVNVEARFTDPGSGETQNVVIDWGDGTTTPAFIFSSASGSGATTAWGTHIYTRAGFYTVKVLATDSDGHTGWDYLNHAVIFDPNNGNVDGSDLEFIDPNGGGTAKLTFNAKYDKGAVLPTGKVELKIGKTFTFTAAQHQQYVALPTGALYIRGTNGALNGETGYDYLISAIWGKPDLVRVQIWTQNGRNRQVVYDTQPGADDLAPAITPVTRGRIKMEF